MKRFLCLALVLSLFALVGCSGDANTATTATTAEIETATEAPTAAQVNTPASLNLDPNAKYEYEVREIWCESNGNRIYGEAYIPITDETATFPLVIHAHGLGSNHEAGEGFCKRYAEKGIAAYTFDFPGGSRPSNENKSDGEPMQMSPVTESADLQAVLDTALAWDFVNTDFVFLEGGSQGGLVSTMVGLDNADKIHGMILMYPALYMPQIITARYGSADEVPDEISFGDDYTLSGKFAKDLFDVDVVSRLGEFPHNVVVIQGSEDSLVSAESSEEASHLFQSAEFHLIDGAGHGFSGDDFDKAADYALSYLFANT